MTRLAKTSLRERLPQQLIAAHAVAPGRQEGDVVIDRPGVPARGEHSQDQASRAARRAQISHGCEVVSRPSRVNMAVISCGRDAAGARANLVSRLG